MANPFTITLAGQDISDYVQWLPDPSSGGGSIPNAQAVKIDSTLGQGAGNGGATSGRAAQATFLTRLPIAQAVGAGTTVSTAPYQTSDYSKTITGDNPTRYYRLGDAAGSSTVADSSSSNQAGTVNGGVTLGQTSLISGDSNGAAKFDGSSGYISIPTTGLPTGNGAWSLEALIDFSAYPSNNPGVFLQFGTWGTSHAVATLGTRTNGSIDLTVFGQDVISPAAVSLNAVHHIVGTYDGTTLRLYVDGTLVNSAAASQSLAISLTSASIGGIPGNSNWYPGVVDEAAIYTYALSASQVVAHYNALTPTTVYPSPKLVRQGEVIIKDPGGVVIFGGYVGKLDDATWRTQAFTQVNCYDYWQQLSHITINEVFDGESDVAAIRSLITKYAPWVDLTLLPAYASGQLLGQVWRNKSLQWGLQKIADITGRQIYIDPSKKLIYNTPTQAYAAPFSLSDDPDFAASFPHAINTYTIDDTAIINRVTLYGGKQPTPDFTQDVSTQANGNNKVFVLAYYPRKSSNGKVIVAVNGADQTLGYAIGTGAANTLKSQGGSADVLLDADARTLTFDVAPAAGASVTCTYRYQLPLVIQLTEKNSYAYYGQYYDGTISDETVVDSATAIQRCRVLLLEQAYGLTSIQLTCWRGGLQAGQQLQLVNSVRGINDTYIIQEVVAQPVTQTDVAYTVTLGAWNWNLVDVLQNLAIRTAGQDLSQQETITPTQVNVANAIASLLAVTVTPTTRPMATYYPGVTSGQGVMYPGLSSI